MGFPNNFIKVGRDSQLYNRIGNSICVNVVIGVAEELKRLLEETDNMYEETPMELLEKTYSIAIKDGDITGFDLTTEQLENVEIIVKRESTNKGVYTALITSLVYKVMYPEQDIRLHQISLPGGYSGRSFDTKYVTPFLKQKRFLGAMKESGWLTRSVEQNHAFNLDFPGKITPAETKSAFLSIIDDVETYEVSAMSYLVNIFRHSVVEKGKRDIVLINPVEREEKLDIYQIIELLSKHFSYKYSTRGGSILPVVAFYSIYESLMKEVARYEDKKLDPLASHYSSDKSSGNSGDIVIRDALGDIYEVVEIKYGIHLNEMIILDAINKIKPNSKLQRYYILSTVQPLAEEEKLFLEHSKKLKVEHGSQLIINGLIKTLNYYLRLIDNTDEFIKNYVSNLKSHPEIQMEQQIVWNKILEIK